MVKRQVKSLNRVLISGYVVNVVRNQHNTDKKPCVDIVLNVVTRQTDDASKKSNSMYADKVNTAYKQRFDITAWSSLAMYALEQLRKDDYVIVDGTLFNRPIDGGDSYYTEIIATSIKNMGQ